MALPPNIMTATISGYTVCELTLRVAGLQTGPHSRILVVIPTTASIYKSLTVVILTVVVIGRK